MVHLGLTFNMKMKMKMMKSGSATWLVVLAAPEDSTRQGEVGHEAPV